MLVLFGFMALDHCTVINSVRPFLFVHKEQFNLIWFFCFLIWIFWVLRFLFLWTFSRSFLRPKKTTIAFLKFSKNCCFLFTVSYILILSVLCFSDKKSKNNQIFYKDQEFYRIVLVVFYLLAFNPNIEGIGF